MDKRKRKPSTTLLVAASLSALAVPLHAATYTEVGDAGNTVATANNTMGTIPLTAISGTIGTITDADLYAITIGSPTLFSATATSTAGIDTSLFLFTSTGVPIIANDDQSNTNFQAAILAGNTLVTSLAAGTYYLGISLSGNEPVNGNNQLLFTTDQPTTSVRGAASGLAPTTESTFNGATFFAETGAYNIAITGSVPEPSSVVTLMLGAAASLVLVHRVRRQRTA